jgi:hypothetical protein
MLDISYYSHRETLARLLAGKLEWTSLKDLVQTVTDEFWLWAFMEGYRTDERLRRLLPGFPPEEVQLRFAGATGDDTIRDAFANYTLVRHLSNHHLNRPL